MLFTGRNFSSVASQLGFRYLMVRGGGINIMYNCPGAYASLQRGASSDETVPTPTESRFVLYRRGSQFPDHWPSVGSRSIDGISPREIGGLTSLHYLIRIILVFFSPTLPALSFLCKVNSGNCKLQDGISVLPPGVLSICSSLTKNT